MRCLAPFASAVVGGILSTRHAPFMDAQRMTFLQTVGNDGVAMWEGCGATDTFLPGEGKPRVKEGVITADAELLKGTVSDDCIKQVNTISMIGGDVDDNVAEYIAANLLSKAHALSRVVLMSTQLSSPGFVRMLKALLHQVPCSKLEELLLRDVHLHAEECAVMGRIIEKHCSRLRRLELQCCHMDDVAGEAIAEAIARAVCLRELRLSDNDMIPSFALPVDEPLTFPKSLELLDLCGNRILPAHYRGLHHAIRSCAAFLKELYLSRSSLRDDGLRLLLDSGIHHSSSLRVLDLSSCCLLRTSGRVFCSILTECPNLERLYLQDNLIEADGAARISVGLPYANKLAVLGMGKCHLGGRGARLIASALKHSRSMHELDLSDNNIGDTDIEYAYAHSGGATVRLKLLNLSGNPLTERSRPALRNLLMVPKGNLCTVLVRNTDIAGESSYLQCGDLYSL